MYHTDSVYGWTVNIGIKWTWQQQRTTMTAYSHTHHVLPEWYALIVTSQKEFEPDLLWLQMWCQSLRLNASDTTFSILSNKPSKIHKFDHKDSEASVWMLLCFKLRLRARRIVMLEFKRTWTRAWHVCWVCVHCRKSTASSFTEFETQF